MDKKLFLAVMLSIAFLFAWGAIMPRLFPELAKPKVAPATAIKPSPPQKAERATATPQIRPVALPAPGAAVPQQVTNRMESIVETDDYIARFSNRGAQLTSFRLKKYQQKKGSPELVELVRPRPRERSDFPFAIVSADAQLNRRVNEALYVLTDTDERGLRQLVYRYTDSSGSTVVKTFRFGDSYRFHFAVQMEPQAPPYRVVIGPGIRVLSPEEHSERFTRVGNGVIQHGGSFNVVPREKAPQFRVYEGMPDFVGLEDNYFLAVLQPERSGAASLRTVQISGAKDQQPRKELYAGLNAVDGQVAGAAFFGPKEMSLLDRYGLDKALQYGVFGIIARMLLAALVWLYGVTKNYGWAIIVLTIIIKVLLYPLQHKSIVSMKKMQKLQPRMNAIKEKYKRAKSDPEQRQKMNTEMMKLYQQEGINPMSGCLPILLQLPILWAFYSLLSVAIELRGAGFMLWINDLSAKDPYYITPVLMTITMFIQQWMTPTTVDPTQRKIFLAMPLIFGWIFKEFPSGLVLYWLVQNILSIIQQAIMNRYWKEHPEELAEVAPSKSAAKPTPRMKSRKLPS